MATSLLIGNGINRVTNHDASWEHVLNALVPGAPSGQALEHIKHKPFALVYEEILLTRLSNDKSVDEPAMKSQIARLVGGLHFNDFHRRVMDSALRHVITTNYDYGFEKAARQDYPRSHLMRESKYSVFRRRAVGDKFVWHIHGEVEAPTTITLGYDQYSGYLQKLRTYATADRESKNGSPFKMGNMDFDHVPGTVYSWLDVFLRDDIHIVGLGLDYTEIDLWWAVTYKARKKAQGLPVGRTFYHDWYVGEVKEQALARRSLLRALSVEVLPRDCADGFENSYETFISDHLEPLNH
jgi:hypothetical protein